MKNTRLILLALLLISAFLFIFRTGSIPVLDGDTAYYATIAKNMLVSGDWLTPTAQLKTAGAAIQAGIVDKPPLAMWTMAAGMRVFGINEFGLSIFHSLMAILVVIFTFLLGKRLFGETVGLYSALILTTCAQFFYQARSPLQDVPLTLFVLASVHFFVVFDQDRKPWYLYLCGLSAALAVLTKGPIGVVLPAAIIFIHLLVERKLFKFNLADYVIHLPLTLLLFLAVTAPWYIYEYFKLGAPFVDRMFGSTIMRYFFPVDVIGNQIAAGAQPQAHYDFFVYFLIILVTAVPWSGFIFPSVYYFFKERKYFSMLPLVYAGVIFLLFSFSLNYKIARYILPAFPALTIMVAKTWEDFMESKTHSHAIQIGNYLNTFFVLPLLGIGTFFLIFSFPKQQLAYQPIVLPFLIVLCLGMLIASVVFILKNYRVAFWVLFGTAVASYTLLIPLMDVYFKDANPSKIFAKQAALLAGKDAALVQFGGLNTCFLDFYADRKFNLANNADELKKAVGPSRALAITELPEQFLAESAKLGKKPRLIASKNSFSLFEVGSK